MDTKGSNMKKSEPEFADFWRNFQISPWKWVDELASRSRYSVSTVLVVYAVYAFMTYFPGRGNHWILLLKDYPSINIILLGFTFVFILFIRWRHQIPYLFQWLWDSERFESQGADLKREFEQYLQNYQKALLSKAKPLSISIFLLLLFIIIGLWAGIPRFLADFFTPMAAFVLYTTILLGLFWLFMIGQLSWVLYVTSSYIGKLPQNFSIKIQPSHSDKCGGLKPLGDFCFDAAIPLIGGGLIVLTIPILDWDIDQVLSLMATTTIFVLIGPLTAMTIFMPLWNVHREMTEQKRAYEDGFAVQAMTLEQTIRVHTSEKGNLKKAEIAREKLEILQSVNPEKIPYPVWPFRFTSTVLAVFSPQILQAITGIIAKAYEFFYAK